MNHSDTRPRFTAANMPDADRCYGKQGTYNGRRMTETDQASNGLYLFSGELGRSSFLTVVRDVKAVDVGMAHVLTSGGPLKIVAPVI